MRFIVHEQAYEKPIASGLLRYERDGRATGAVESWRLTKAVEGYEILRVDLDARAAESGHSYLYHLVRRADGRAERLSYRFWGDGIQVEGTLLFLETSITGTRTVNGKVYEEDLETTRGYNFWFPSSLGLSLLNYAPVKEIQPCEVQTITLFSPSSSLLPDILSVTELRVYLSYDDDDVIAKDERAVASLLVQWDREFRRIWSNEWRLTVRMERSDGLTAVETRSVWYGDYNGLKK